MDFLLRDTKNFLDTGIFYLLLISALAYWFGFVFPSFAARSKVGFWSVLLSNLCLTFLMLLRWVEAGYFPLSNLYESLLFFTWGCTFVLLILESLTQFVFLGAIITPLATFVMGFATLSLPEDMQQAVPLVPALKSNWLMMHVSVMMFSYATLVIGSLLSVVFLFLSFGKIQLQGSTPKAVMGSQVVDLERRSSFLKKISDISYRVIGFGFPLLTVGIITGAVWANEAWGSYWSWDPKETWALVTWLVFAAYLHLRLTESEESKGSAILASIGFVVVWICYLGVNFLGKGLHTYGWIA